ncbi:MAG: type II toxin-antitoxin system PrlF family antitoxin [Chloroflexi bacterium]|nr:type II toxin-antitoxin system PrlF family antitoxin [Chloroflexota bacterium]
MKELLTTVTQRGQVTIPAEVRRLLGVKPRDKVAFTIAEGRVELAPARFTLASAYQSVPPLQQPLSDEEMAKLAKEEKAERTVRKLRTP